MTLEETDVYTGKITNKRKYRPKDVPSDDIDQNFQNIYVGDVDVLEAMTPERPEGNTFGIFCLK